MTFGRRMRETLSGFVDLARIASASWAAAGSDDPGGPSAAVASVRPIFADESAPALEAHVYGQMGVSALPKAASGEDGAEAVIVDLGDQPGIISTRDLRFAVEPAEGETVLHALGADGTRQAKITLQPGGVAIIEADEVRIGVSGASHPIAYGDVLTDLLAVIYAWVPVANDGGAKLKADIIAALGATPPAAESTHKVE